MIAIHLGICSGPENWFLNDRRGPFGGGWISWELMAEQHSGRRAEGVPGGLVFCRLGQPCVSGHTQKEEGRKGEKLLFLFS